MTVLKTSLKVVFDIYSMLLCLLGAGWPGFHRGLHCGGDYSRQNILVRRTKFNVFRIYFCVKIQLSLLYLFSTRFAGAGGF